MADKTREVGVRLSVKDADVAARALQAFGAEGAGALKAIQSASQQANPSLVLLSQGIQRSKEYAADFAVEGARSFLGPIAAIGTATAAVELLRDAIEKVQKVAETGDLAERIGLNVGDLQGLQATFKESGNDVDELDQALQTFSANLAKPDSPLQQLFKLNNVKISGDTLTDLKTMADLVKNAANQQQRLQLVTLAAGRGSKELVDLMSGGAPAIARAADEAQRLGTAVGDADVQRARDLTSELAQTDLKLDASKEKFGQLITPAVIAVLDTFNDTLEHTTDLLGAIEKMDFKKIAGIIGRDDGDHPSLFGKNGSVAIDWLGNGQFVTGNRDLLFKGNANGSGSPDDRSSTPVQIEVDGGSSTGKGTTRLPSSSADAAQKAIDNVTKSLKLQIENLTETNRQQAINNALSQAHITLADKQGPAIAKLAGEFYDQKKAIDDVNQATSFLAQTGEQGFESLIDGTKSWQDLLGDVVSSLEKAVLQAALLGSGPLAGILGTSPTTSGQTGGAFGWLASLFTNKSANGNVFAGMSGLSAYENAIVHKPTMFAFANGIGLMGEEAGSPGEAVMPLKRDSQGRLGVAGGGSVQVNLQVINNAGVSVTAEQSRDPSGGVNLKLMVEKIAANSLATPGSAVHRAARTVFGLKPQTTRRGA